MPNQQLVDYIKQSLAQGYSGEEIKDALLRASWDEEDIDGALRTVEFGGQEKISIPTYSGGIKIKAMAN